MKVEIPKNGHIVSGRKWCPAKNVQLLISQNVPFFRFIIWLYFTNFVADDKKMSHLFLICGEESWAPENGHMVSGGEEFPSQKLSKNVNFFVFRVSIYNFIVVNKFRFLDYFCINNIRLWRIYSILVRGDQLDTSLCGIHTCLPWVLKTYESKCS